MEKSLSRMMSLLTLGTGLAACSTVDQEDQTQTDPNIVLIFLDDAGWADFQPFTETRYPTPNVRQLTEEGKTFYNFYVPQAVCSASRAALLTGCYPERVNLFGAHAPRQRGLDPEFATMGEILQEAGYKTAFFGKWHIGDHPDTRPPERGFDESAGIMYSNDMWSDHPENPDYWGQWPLQFWENGEITIDSVTAKHQTWFTTWFTEKSVDFINRHKDEPFFLYIPHPQPHVPLFVSDKFAGKSGTGLYGDVMMELDWSVGEVMKALKENGIEDNTIVIFSSDNGPWLAYGNHAGKTPYRGEKGTSFDGGIRSPLIIKYPGQIEAGTISQRAFMSIDFLPTLAGLTNAELPDYEIDGKNVWDVITGNEGAENPQEYYGFTMHNRFEGVISSDGKWKLHLPHNYRYPVKGGTDGMAGVYTQMNIDTALFDMVHDPYEKVNVIEEYPEMAKQLIQLAEEHKIKFFSEPAD
ncbi:MAG: sulfatase [Bacteroidales bacterium]